MAKPGNAAGLPLWAKPQRGRAFAPTARRCASLIGNKPTTLLAPCPVRAKLSGATARIDQSFLHPRTVSNGFTLIEVMVVVAILAILAALVVPRIMDRPDEARIIKAKQDIRAIESALQLYRLDNFNYPSTDQGLEALVSRPSASKTSAARPRRLWRWAWPPSMAQMPADSWPRCWRA